MKLHADQLDISSALVEALLARQLPSLAGLLVTPVRSTGTVNAIFRIGPAHCARLPLVPAAEPDLLLEVRWLPWLADRLPVRIPRPVFTGTPDAAYPSTWAVYEWLDGAPYADGLADERTVAESLAAFVLALRRLDPSGAPAAGRRPLRQLDRGTRDALAAAVEIDRPAALALWDRALTAPVWDGARVWRHADLMRPNVLVRDGRVSAIIDFGAAGAGDPAADVVAAWTVFGAEGRAAYRAALDVPDDVWLRAAGYALTQAALIIPYYRDTNPRFVTDAVRTVRELLAEDS